MSILWRCVANPFEGSFIYNRFAWREYPSYLMMLYHNNILTDHITRLLERKKNHMTAIVIIQSPTLRHEKTFELTTADT
jgi:hypothetical protein